MFLKLGCISFSKIRAHVGIFRGMTDIFIQYSSFTCQRSADLIISSYQNLLSWNKVYRFPLPRRHSRLVACAYIKESTLSWNIQSVYQKKTRFVWTGAAKNRWVLMTFLLFAPASKRCLGWRKTENPEGTAKVDFVTFIVQSYFDTLLRYVLSVTFCGAAVLKVINEKTLVKRWWSYKAPTTVYIYKHPWRVCQTRVHKSLIGNNLQDTLSLP